MNTDTNALNIFTDGALCHKTKRGGVGIVFVYPEYLERQPLEYSPLGYKKSTNNEMELKACCLALEKSIDLGTGWSRIVVHSDSQYMVDNYKRALFQWSRQGWRNNDGKPVLNVKIWKELLHNANKTRKQVDIVKVRAHSGDEFNEKADALAEKSKLGALNDPLKVTRVRRKYSNKKTKLGSIDMSGQIIRIHLIEVTYLQQNEYIYRYEVMSPGSLFFGCVDQVYYHKALRVGHEYKVRMNTNSKYPQIAKIFKDYTEDAKIAALN
ncbi:MAG: RNase H family protein [bacterium]|nr:RNase H family protein [bacterium]